VRSRWWLRLLQVVLLALVGWGIYRALAPQFERLNWDDLGQYRPAIAPLLLSVVLLLAFYALHALIWRRITEALSSARVELRPGMQVYFISGLGRYLPGKLWQIAGMAVLAQRAGIEPVAATAAHLLGNLGFMTMGMIFLAVLLPSEYGWEAAVAALALIAIAVAVFVVGATERGKELRHRMLSRVGAKVAEAATLLDRVTLSRASAWWVAYGLSWVVLGAAFALFVDAFVPSASEHALRIAGVVAASYLAGFLLFTPAGIGVREGAMVPLLAAVIPFPAAVLVSITSRIWFTIGELLPLVFLPLLPAPVALPADQKGKA
jgi:hypothetical protein